MGYSCKGSSYDRKYRAADAAAYLMERQWVTRGSKEEAELQADLQYA